MGEVGDQPAPGAGCGWRDSGGRGGGGGRTQRVEGPAGPVLGDAAPGFVCSSIAGMQTWERVSP